MGRKSRERMTGLTSEERFKRSEQRKKQRERVERELQRLRMRTLVAFLQSELDRKSREALTVRG